MPDALLLWAIALTVGVPAALVLGAYVASASHRRRLRRDGRTVEALVSSLVSNPGDGLTSATYWANVQYDDDGDFVTTRVSISRAEYDRYRVGTGVLVAYLPGRTTSARRLEDLVR